MYRVLRPGGRIGISDVVAEDALDAAARAERGSVKVLHEGIGIRHGSITALHDMTNTQTIVDAPHKDLRRARAALSTMVVNETQVKVYAWYDNEWGYANRMIDLARLVGAAAGR